MRSHLNLSDRADAEYVSKENLLVESRVHHLPHKKLGVLGELIASAFYPAATQLYGEGDVPFVRCVDCIDYPLISKQQDASFERIPQSFVDANSSVRSVGMGDIVITKVGSPCYASIVHEHSNLALSRTVLGMIKIKDVDPYYLTAFLRSRYGFSQLMRQREQTIQYQLTLERVRDVDVFLPSKLLQGKIAKVFRKSASVRAKATQSLEEAERVLLRSLELESWRPREPLSYRVSSREAFAASRLDAEHFKPKYKALANHIDATGSAEFLADCLAAIQRGKQPAYADDGLPVINSKHVLRGEVLLNEDNRFAKAAAGDILIQRGDVLLNGTGVGTIGRSSPYLHQSQAIPDNHVTVLRPKAGLDAVYLSVFLNSCAGQLQVDQRLHGSSGQIELYPSDIAAFKVWVAPAKVQAEIRGLVDRSFDFRRRAGELLSDAKRAVEMAIETSESSAVAFLEELQ